MSTWESSPNSSENNKNLKPPYSNCINSTKGAGILSNSSISPIIGLSCALMVFQLALQFKQSIFNCAKSFLGAKCSRVSCQYIASHHGLMACPQAQLLSWRLKTWEVAGVRLLMFTGGDITMKGHSFALANNISNQKDQMINSKYTP